MLRSGRMTATVLDAPHVGVITLLAGLLAIALVGCNQKPHAQLDASTMIPSEIQWRVRHIQSVNTASKAGHVTVTAALPDQALDTAKEVKVPIEITIEPGFFIYGLVESRSPFTPLSVNVLADDKAVNVEPIQIPKAELIEDGKPVYRNSIAVPLSIRFADPKPSTVTLTITVQFQACNDLACLPPADIIAELEVLITSSPLSLKGEPS
ncbi:disulfide bond corrector protein DsbC [Roseimaritima ulvae]|uniref:Disulfide bond corrector protein DsbC n=2 Tax=Roseimaritima ulvae TaxID=980254 RepID=A0A5B9QM63_9BACT|nr:disulfide bond corrector protein DsbC [Roseimaritima ulvae]